MRHAGHAMVTRVSDLLRMRQIGADLAAASTVETHAAEPGTHQEVGTDI